MYSLVRSTVNQLGNMSAAGRRSPSQDDAPILLYSVLRRPAAACNVLRHCPAATVLTWHVALRKVKYIKNWTWNRFVTALHWFTSWLIAAWTLVVPRISLEIVSCGGLRRPAASCGHWTDPFIRSVVTSFKPDKFPLFSVHIKPPKTNTDVSLRRKTTFYFCCYLYVINK